MYSLRMISRCTHTTTTLPATSSPNAMYPAFSSTTSPAVTSISISREPSRKEVRGPCSARIFLGSGPPRPLYTHNHPYDSITRTLPTVRYTSRATKLEEAQTAVHLRGVELRSSLRTVNTFIWQVYLEKTKMMSHTHTHTYIGSERVC